MTRPDTLLQTVQPSFTNPLQTRGRPYIAASLAGILADDALSPRMRRLIEQLREEWHGLDAAIAELDAEFKTIARQEEPSRQLMTIPGFGPLAATALRAAIGRGEAMNNGRDLAAYLGLVPRQDSTGGRTRLLGISKRGDRYLRTLLIHGARAALPHLAAKDTPLGRWLRGLRARCHHNVAVVARQQARQDRLGRARKRALVRS
jgi:transposase